MPRPMVDSPDPQRVHRPPPPRHLRHEQTVGHPLLEVPDEVRLGARDRDRHRIVTRDLPLPPVLLRLPPEGSQAASSFEPVGRAARARLQIPVSMPLVL
jgi:hypothetical protein